jgi:hypothetical protein
MPTCPPGSLEGTGRRGQNKHCFALKELADNSGGNRQTDKGSIWGTSHGAKEWSEAWMEAWKALEEEMPQLGPKA